MSATSVSSRTDPPPESDPAAPVIEGRVRRLEDAVVSLQDTRLMEERLVERVLARLEADGPRSLPPPSPGPSLLLEAGRLLLPAPREPEPAASADAAPPPVTTPLAAASASSWFVIDLFHEVRAIVGMFLDYRFRVSWTGRVVPAVCGVTALLSWFFVGSAPLIGWILERLLLIVLAMVAYKALSRDAARYRATFPLVRGRR